MTASLLTALQLAGPIPASDHEQILAAWEPRTVGEGEFLVRAGTVCQDVFFIQQGILRTVFQPLMGRETTHHFQREQQFCTLLAGFNDQLPSALSIQAACPTQVLAISRARMDRLYEQLPYLAGLMVGIIQRTLQEKIQTRQVYLGQDAAASYRLFLQQQPDIARRVPQHMIASYLGITPQSLSRLRKTRV